MFSVRIGVMFDDSFLSGLGVPDSSMEKGSGMDDIFLRTICMTILGDDRCGGVAKRRQRNREQTCKRQ